jgi:3-hydroxybutyryl-CoA dehydrogenase
LDRIGVIGLGTMGAGIAQLALEAGHPVDVHDTDSIALAHARDRIRTGLERRATRLDLEPDSADAWVDGRLDALHEVGDLGALARARPSVVIEAVAEDLGVKQRLVADLDRTLGPDPLIATNTSAISIADIAAVASVPGRVVGLHFFNPVVVMPLVELVIAPSTDSFAADRANAIATSWGKTVVRCADTPGFIVNRVNRPFTLEALAMVADRATTIGQVDAAIRGAGFPMGPFELMDLIGIDVNLSACRGIHERSVTASDPLAERFHPSPIQEELVATGHLGRKTGAGFYQYGGDGKMIGPAAGFADGTSTPTRDRDEIVERITLALVNEAYRALGEGVATTADIDLALRLGAGHPIGPFERAAELGGAQVVRARLEQLKSMGPRFAVAPALVS